jgi:peptide/nickel transport system substrate-binding protein
MVAKDARTLVVTWNAPYAYYAYFRNHEPLPKHLLGPVFEKDKRALGRGDSGTRPVLGGAFTVAEWVPQSHIRLRRNPHAKAMAPALDEIVWKIIPQTQTMEAAFLSGAVDVISVIGFTFDQARDFAARHPEAVTHFTPALMLEHIDLNLDHPALQDRRVRQALVHALDRETLVQQLFGGKQPVAHSSEPDDNDDPGVVRYAFDPGRARALLDEAGFVVGDDGVRRKGEVALRFTLHSTAGDRLREQVEQLLVGWWKAVGVDVVIQNQPAKLLFGETIRRRKFDGMVMFTWTKEPNKIDETYWRCDQKPTEQNAWQGRNYPGFCDPRVDALLDEASRTVDETKRRALHRQIARILSEEVPMIPLYDRVDVSVTPKGFSGWRPTGLLQSVAWNAQEWRFDAPTATTTPTPPPTTTTP